jgi:hypothetical protein
LTKRAFARLSTLLAAAADEGFLVAHVAFDPTTPLHHVVNRDAEKRSQAGEWDRIDRYVVSATPSRRAAVTGW